MGTRDEEKTALLAEIARLRAVNEELSARAHRAEAELRSARAVHEATISSLPFDFWARDREGYCFSQNEVACAKWGDLRGKRPEDTAVPPEVVAVWLDNNRRALAGEIVRGEVVYTLDAEVRHFHNILAPIRREGAIVGTLGVNVEITDWKRAESERAQALEALRESQEKLRMTVAAAGIGLWSWNLQSDEVLWEPPLSAIFGLPAGTSPDGRAGFLALIHPEDRARVADTIARGVAAGGWEDEFRILRADGALRWVIATGTVVQHAGRAVVLGVVLDVSERHLREQRSREAQKLEAVGQLTAGIAHNFNNMLMGILPNLALAERDAPRPIVPLLQSAHASAQRAAQLVRQLMTYAGRNRPVERKVEPIEALARRAVDLCRTTFDRGIALEERYDERARARVDDGLLEQALLNILINARDAVAGKDAPSLSLEVEVVPQAPPELEARPDGYVRIRVTDNGVGMEPAVAARVFEPFFTTKPPGRGTGLGLPTTQAIVREHGGWVGCESTAGRGTTFSLFLPQAAEPPAPQACSLPPTSARGSETVLVIDDEAPVRRVVSLILEGAGYATALASSGEEAVALLGDGSLASKVAAVLLDVSMPGMPRRELRGRLQELIPRARVIYFTGYSFDTADADDAVLEKPVTEAALLAAIRRAIDE